VSKLADAAERFVEDVCCVVIAALSVARVASVVDEVLERLFELVLIAPRAPSTLADEVER